MNPQKTANEQKEYAMRFPRSSVPRTLGTDAARAVGRFTPSGSLGYRARSMPDAPLRATREEAESDESDYLDSIQEHRGGHR